MPPTKQGEDAKKRKAEADATGTPAAQKPKKMSKEEKAAARERARSAMTSRSAAAPAKKAAPKAAPKKSPKRATRAAAAKVTIKDPPAPKASPDTMPAPPTSLQRTQSTPLELELEQQVVANLKADMEGKAPVFAEAPPAHLLKFAPTELEEGYDHDETNARDPLDDDQDVKANTTQQKSRRSVLPTSKSRIVMEFLLIGVWVYLFWGREGTFYHRWTHEILARVPFGSPYRLNGKPIPFLPCFETNVDDPPVPMTPECEDMETTVCPAFGTCYGGHLQSCAEPYLTVAANRKTCEMVPAVQSVYDHVVNTVTTWTMDHRCDRKAYSKLFENYDESPAPRMMVSMRDTDPPTKQPMFHLEYILDLNPFLLQTVPNGGMGRDPIQSLHQVVEVANQVADHWLKLQILTRYGEIIEETGERQVHHEYLVARVPSKQSWWRRRFSPSTQCKLLRTKASVEFALRTPWLIGVWVTCMVMFVVWFIVMRYYWMKAQQQQEVLAAIEVVRGFVLETIATTSPKQWKGTELQEYVVQNGPQLVVEEIILRKRIWPRVVFDIRGNPNVGKSVSVASGELVDVWWWEPREEQAAQE